MGPNQDREIIAASTDDPGAFVEIFDRHYDTIHRFVARRVGPDQADDITATVFVEALAGRARFDQRAPSARPWLYGIATNLLRRHRRTEERRLRAYARHGLDDVAHDDGVEGRADSAATQPAIARALARLAPRDRDALLLFAWADLSYDEIAIATGVPIGTVRSRLHRARQIMRRDLGAIAPDAPLSSRGETDG